MIRRVPPPAVQDVVVQMLLDTIVDEWTPQDVDDLVATLCQQSPELFVVCLVDAVMDMWGVEVTAAEVVEKVYEAYEVARSEGKVA